MISEDLEVEKRPRALSLIRELVSYHPGMFVIAMLGAAVFAVFTVASSWGLRWVIDEVIMPRFDSGERNVATLLTGVALLIGIALVRAAGVIIRRTWAGKTEWKTAESITGEVVERLIEQTAPWHRHQRTGDLITRAGVDVEATVAILAPLPYASSVFLMMVVAAIGMLVLDVVLGIVAIAVFPLLIIANVLYQNRVDQWYDLAQEQLGLLSSAAHESFEAITVVKAFGAEESEGNRLGTIAERVRAARVRAVGIRSVFETMLDLLPNLTNVVLVLVGVHRVDAGHLTIGGLASFIYLFSLLVFPLRIVGYALSELPRSQAGFARIHSLMVQPLVDDPRIKIVDSLHTDDPEACVTLRGVRARHVDPDVAAVTGVFPDGDETLDDLSDVDLDVVCGSMVAVVGPTGSAKTTLLEVIAGILPTSAGVVTGPRSVAVVFQEAFLLGASILDNVMMGRSNEASDVVERVRWALEVAEADFVDELPNGVATVVGERGVSLSGGQRQRVALARAVFGRPTLLLLDDTTSALDPVTERKVVDNLRRELPATTIISVASRPSLIRIADSVIFMESGRIVARGRHEDLLTRSASYAELISAFERDRGRDE